ncbi:MAG: response regulator [Acidobacteriota bacterium]
MLTTSLLAADVEMPGVLELGGTWRLTLEGHDTNAESKLGDSTQELSFPASWRQLGLIGYEGQLLLERDVELPPSWRNRFAPSGLAILVDSAKYGSYELVAGGQAVGGLGGRGRELPAPSQQVFAIPSSAVGSDDTLRLALSFRRVGWASDLVSGSGPAGSRLLLGDMETITELAERDRQRSRLDALHSILIAVLLAAAGLYHLQLFSRRRDRAEYLWFGLTAIDFAAVVFAVRLSYSLTDSFAVGRRLSALTIHLAVVLLIQLLWTYLERPIKSWLRRYQLSHLLIAALVLILPIEWVVRSNTLRWIWVLPLLAGLGALLASRSWQGNPDARTIGIGGLMVVGAGIAELVYQVLGRGTIYPVPAWAFGFFGLSMAVSLSNRYSRLHLELDSMRYQLEQKVEDATVELSAANSKLRAENAERQLAEESMRMLERAVEQSIDGIVVADLAGSTQFLNEAWARMHGYEVTEVLGYDLNLFHTREQMQDAVYPLLKTVRERGSFDGEVGHRRKDGSTFPTWMTVNLLRDPDGEAVGIVAIARDISQQRSDEAEQVELETRLQQAARLESLGDLAAGIAHDYNNLLTGMMVHADLALREIDESAAAYEKIRQIERTAERAADLSDELLAFAGEEEPERETLQLNDLLRGLEPQLEERIPDRSVLQFQLKKALPPVDVDPDQLRRIVLRLVTNAVDAVGSSPGVITIRTSSVEATAPYFMTAQPAGDHPAGTYVFFEVSDSGIGIDEETRARMFDPFFSTKASGRGLGLATVLGIVRSHGGAIKVYSEPGKGTTFEVLFPASEKPETVARPRPFETARADGTILVVDDEDLVLEVTQEILESRGWQVLIATGGVEAVDIYRQQGSEIAAVVLDMTMPEMDGEEVFEALREIDPEVKIIIMSGYSRKKISRRILDMGLGGFLHKPFRPQELIDKLHDMLEA